jgi:MinD superfamily P-loop ATPase
MTHAKLGVAEENSGRLVTIVRDKAKEVVLKYTELDKIIVDGAPGTGCPVIASLTGVDYALIVTEPTVSGVHDLKRVLEVTSHFKVKSGIIINKFDLNLKQSLKIETIAKALKIKILGRIQYDKAFTQAQIKGLTIIEYSNNETTEQIKQTWEKVKQEIGIR